MLPHAATQRILFPVFRVTMSEQGGPMIYQWVRGAPEGLGPNGDESPVQKGSPFKFLNAHGV